MIVVGGAGMKEMVDRIRSGDSTVPVDVTYPPSMISTAIEMTVVGVTGAAPMSGEFIIASELITPENADDFYFLLGQTDPTFPGLRSGMMLGTNVLSRYQVRGLLGAGSPSNLGSNIAKIALWDLNLSANQCRFVLYPTIHRMVYVYNKKICYLDYLYRGPI